VAAGGAKIIKFEIQEFEIQDSGKIIVQPPSHEGTKNAFEA
jgi:hypothetical protein